MNIRPYRQHRPELGARVFVDEAAVVIGRVQLGDDVSVWPCTVIRGDVNYIAIGADSNIQDGSVLHVTRSSGNLPTGQPLIVGKGVTVGHAAVLHACTIGDYCLIGMGATVLDGATIGDHVLVAAGAVVTPGKKLEPRGLYVGSPARRARDLTEAELTELEDSAQRYKELKDEYLQASDVDLDL